MTYDDKLPNRGGTKVFAHSYWVQWGRWIDRPKMIESRTLLQAQRPFYNGRGIGIRIGKHMLSVGICSPIGSVLDRDFDRPYTPEEEAYVDWLTWRFTPAASTDELDLSGTEAISYPGWKESKAKRDAGEEVKSFQRPPARSVAKAIDA